MFRFDHSNLHVLNLERSVAFYKKALDLIEITRLETKSFIFVYMGDVYRSEHVLELQLVRNRMRSYRVDEGNTHLAFATDNFKESYLKHKRMGCVCGEFLQFGIYWIKDPDGYLVEILSENWERGHQP